MKKVKHKNKIRVEMNKDGSWSFRLPEEKYLNDYVFMDRWAKAVALGYHLCLREYENDKNLQKL